MLLLLQFELNCITFVVSRFVTFSVKLYYYCGGVTRFKVHFYEIHGYYYFALYNR